MGIINKAEPKKEQIRDAMVYNIWLAGLGAYAKSREEVNQLSDKGKSLFDELIERGRALESKTKERVHASRSQTSVAIEERMHSMVQKCIGIDNERLDRVDDKIDQLTASIEVLLEKQKAAQESGKTPVRKPVAKKASVARRKNVKAAQPVPPKNDAPKNDAVKPEAEKAVVAQPVKVEQKEVAKPVEAAKPAVAAEVKKETTN
ncbi:phasin-related domain-containing protein [Photobacterium aquae]|uniref:phasin-related domain-containing protein n=1 Tax=Photobacterium aquae TaxID=1195763 RepID=UPI0009FED38E|nr:phasin family protein [Photobacterium aquae]